jgi:murein DD-endopeptidase MepM/ murein hydrolase activator NlpD
MSAAPFHTRALCRALVALALLALAPAAGAMGSPGTAALQVGLKARGLYGGTIHGVATAETRTAVRRLQRSNGLRADGIAGPTTRAALGPYGRYPLGRRAIRSGMRGWDVAALQFLLAWHGFPSGTLDGDFGPRTGRALRLYQGWRGLGSDGVAGAATIRALLREPPPQASVVLRTPVHAPVTDRFGPRGSRFHTGIDFPTRSGAPVLAARAGIVTFAGWDAGGYGNLVVVRHRPGLRTFYAHLSRLGLRKGARVSAGQRLGAVGATGFATGPHLHFELRVRGAAADPLPAFR